MNRDPLFGYHAAWCRTFMAERSALVRGPTRIDCADAIVTDRHYELAHMFRDTEHFAV